LGALLGPPKKGAAFGSGKRKTEKGKDPSSAGVNKKPA